MAKLYELAEEYQQAFDALEADADGVIIGYENIEALEGAFEEKAESAALYYKGIVSDIEAFKNEKATFDKKIKAAEKRAEWLAGYIDTNMRRMGFDKIKTPRVALTYRTSTKVIVDDLEAVPEQYKTLKTEVAVDKVALKNAHKAGEVIPGAHVEENKNLQIK